MKKQRSPFPIKITNNETDISSLPHPEFKKKIIKILRKLRKAIGKNADHCNKELETIKMNSKIDNSIITE